MRKIMNLLENLNWNDAEGYPKGTKSKILRDGENGKTVLLKLPKGFLMGSHSHITTEQHFVLEGEYMSDGEVFPVGSYQIFPSGDEHGPFKSENGALVLIFWDPFKKN